MSNIRHLALWVCGVLLILAAILHFRYRLFAPSTLSSICGSPTVGYPDLDLVLTLTPRFAGEIQCCSHEVDAAGHPGAALQYRDRAYAVTQRKNGRQVCFQFFPPLPLPASEHTIKADLGQLQAGLSELLFERWPFAFGLTAIAVWLVALAKRNRRMSIEAAEDRTLADVMPEFAEELERLLRAQGEDGLAAQIAELRIVDRCRCGDEFCSTFYVQPKPEGGYGPGHRNIDLGAEQGMLILDVVGDRIAAVEVLHRDEIRDRVRRIV